MAKFEGRRRKKRDKQSLVIYHKITSFLVFIYFFFLFFFFFTKNLHKTMAFGLKINFNDMFKTVSFYPRLKFSLSHLYIKLITFSLSISHHYLRSLLSVCRPLPLEAIVLNSLLPLFFTCSPILSPFFSKKLFGSF